MTVVTHRPAARPEAPPPCGDLRILPVTSMMTAEIVWVSSGTPVMRAMDIYLGTGLRHLVVVDTMGRGLGVVALEAVAVRLMGHATPPAATMAEMLPASVTTVAAHTTVAGAAASMMDGLVDALCVVDCELYPVGIVTWSDIVGLVAGSGRRRTQKP